MIPSLVALVRDGDYYAGLCAVQLLEVYVQFDGYSEEVYTAPYGGYGCVAVMGAGGITPLISLARDGVPLAQQSACVVLAAFGERDLSILVLVREEIAALVREGASPLLMALARGSSDSELSRSSDIELSRELSSELSEVAVLALSSLSTVDRVVLGSGSCRRW